MESMKIVNLREKSSRLQTAIRVKKSACNTVDISDTTKLGELKAEIALHEAELKETRAAILSAELEALEQ